MRHETTFFFFHGGVWAERRECFGVAGAVSTVTLFLITLGIPLYVGSLPILVVF